MQTLISPHYPPEKLSGPSLEDLIDVFEDRVRFWVLEPAKELASHPYGQVAGFNLLLSYFEGIWIYIQGRDSRGKSKAFFNDAFVDVFKPCKLDPQLLRRVGEVLYEDARCGFFHDGLFRHRIYFGKSSGCLTVTVPLKDGVPDPAGEIQSIIVDVADFARYAEGHLARFISQLRDVNETELRSRFQDICREKWDYEGTPQVIAL